MVGAGLLVALAAALVAAVALGPVRVPLGETARVLVGAAPEDPRWSTVVGTLRVPRALTAVLAGSALGVAGLQLQTLFRNPLAEPYVLGVSSGASLGVGLVVVGAGGSGAGFAAGLAGAGRVGVVVAAALGSALVLALVLLLARWARSAVTLLLVGVMVGSASTAALSVLLVWTEPERAQQFLLWGLGSFSATTWSDLRVLAPCVVAGLAAAAASARALDALLLGEAYARTMGVDVRRTRLLTLLSASLLAGATTAFCGPVAFLGLAVPHLARRAFGTSGHRVLLPGCAVLGAVLALVCAVVSQAPGSGTVLPLNAVTSFVGAPVVVAVLLRSRVAL
ncbi:iron ABC transporter permease [Vallicoccus soli]|uniref:Iron ABC transporter permease n=1 Tax=Vallicoccus soli TaxID=2339232 RepID=A0A3A3YXZ1_9ACTN|nr:iron ABC transporter permease [Vallicoccus soli]